MKYKKIIRVVLSCILLICTSLPTAAINGLTVAQDAFTYDHLWAVVGMQVLSEADDEETIWNEDSYITGIIPLYGSDDEIMAYYVKIAPSGYMIVNADINNPGVLEFAYSHDNYTEINAEYSGGQKIYYNGPRSLLVKKNNEYYFIGGNTYEKISETEYTQNNTTIKNSINGASTNAINMEKVINLHTWINYIELNDIATFNTETVNNVSTVVSTNNYGIIGSGLLPTGSYTSGILYGCSLNNIDYVVTGDFTEDYVYNHCASTSAANMMAYYAWYYSDDSLLENSNTEHTFYVLYEDYLGPGPVWVDEYQDGINDYLYYNTQYDVNFGTITSWSGAKSHLAYYDDGDNHMLYLLIWDGLEAHYVNGVGYRDYSSGSQHVRIIDNWNRNINYYINYSSLGALSEIGYCDIYSLYGE